MAIAWASICISQLCFYLAIVGFGERLGNHEITSKAHMYN